MKFDNRVVRQLALRVPGSTAVAAPVAALLVLACPNASARSGGIAADGCVGCHGNGGIVELSVTPDVFEPNDVVRVQVRVLGADGDVAGLYVSSGDVGEFSFNDGSLRSVTPTSVVHQRPKPISGGAAVFDLDWQAPSEAGRVTFKVSALDGDGNGRSSGDKGDSTRMDLVFGCVPREFFPDFDGDGYGRRSAGVIMDCRPTPGYTDKDGDCDEADELINPGMREECNEIDDNCDGRIDERAYPTCGVGWCRRRTLTCDPESPCTPGEPVEETCNGLDDDCDDTVDEGELCEGGLVCHFARCKTIEEALAEDPEFMPGTGLQAPPENIIEDTTPPASGGAPTMLEPGILGTGDPESSGSGCSVRLQSRPLRRSGHALWALVGLWVFGVRRRRS